MVKLRDCRKGQNQRFSRNFFFTPQSSGPFGGFFFQIFLAHWKIQNLDAKLRTNDCPEAKKCSSVAEPVFQDASILHLRERMFFMFVPEISVNHLSNLKKNYKNVCDTIYNSLLYKICRKCIIYYYTYSQTTWIYILV